MDRTQQHLHQLGTAPRGSRSQSTENHTTEGYLTAIVYPAFIWVALMVVLMGVGA